MTNERYFYVGPNKKPVGPYTLSELQSLAARGVIKPTTKAIRKGDRQWVAYSQLSPSAPAVAPAPVRSKPELIAVLQRRIESSDESDDPRRFV